MNTFVWWWTRLIHVCSVQRGSSSLRGIGIAMTEGNFAFNSGGCLQNIMVSVSIQYCAFACVIILLLLPCVQICFWPSSMRCCIWELYIWPSQPMHWCLLVWVGTVYHGYIEPLSIFLSTPHKWIRTNLICFVFVLLFLQCVALCLREVLLCVIFVLEKVQGHLPCLSHTSMIAGAISILCSTFLVKFFHVVSLDDIALRCPRCLSLGQNLALGFVCQHQLYIAFWRFHVW